MDEFTGIHFPGEDFGSRWLVNRGVGADCALIGETSGFGAITAECSPVYLKIRVKGREVYTSRLERGPSLKENPNAFVKAVHLVLAPEECAPWSTSRGRGGSFPFGSGEKPAGDQKRNRPARWRFGL